MTNTKDGLTPGDRRELKTIVRGRFKILREEVKCREGEMRSEVMDALVVKYRDEDKAIAAAKTKIDKLIAGALEKAEGELANLRAAYPNLTASIDRYYTRAAINIQDQQRAAEAASLMAKIPTRVRQALTQINRSEMDMLAELSVGALETEAAKEFMARIPDITNLIPKIEASNVAELAARG